MQPEGSLSCSQNPATSPYPDPDASSPHFPSYFPKIHSNIILPSTPRFSESSFPFRFSNQNFVCMHDARHRIHFKSWSSGLWHCCEVVWYHRFGGPRCLHLQGEN